MPILARAAGTYRTGTPRFKRTGVYITPTKVFRRVSGGYQEIWPMLPGVPTALVGSANYSAGTDRVDMVFTWSAPGAGFTVVSYTVNVLVNGAAWNSYSVASPGLTLTNGGLGYQSSAGATITWNVTANSANGSSAVINGNSFVIAQVGAPPTPVITANTVSGGTWTTTWTYSGGNNTINYFYVQVNGVNYYASGSARSLSHGSPPAGTNMNIYVIAYGPNGYAVSAVASVQAPRMPQSVAAKMLAGYLRTTWTADAGSPASFMEVWSYAAGSWEACGSVNLNNQAYDSTASAAWPRMPSYAATPRYIYVRPYNSYGTGVLTYIGFVRKINNPYFITADDERILLDEVLNDNPTHLTDSNYLGQGWDNGKRVRSYILYGNKFYDELSAQTLGYKLTIENNVNGLVIGLSRAAAWWENTSWYYISGTPQNQSPYIWLHQAANVNELNSGGWTGPTTLPTMWRPEINRFVLPNYWLYNLIDPGYDHVRLGTSGTTVFKGLGFYDPGLGWGLPDYPHIALDEHQTGTYTAGDGTQKMYNTVEIYHDG